MFLARFATSEQGVCGHRHRTVAADTFKIYLPEVTAPAPLQDRAQLVLDKVEEGNTLPGLAQTSCAFVLSSSFQVRFRLLSSFPALTVFNNVRFSDPCSSRFWTENLLGCILSSPCPSLSQSRDSPGEDERLGSAVLLSWKIHLGLLQLAAASSKVLLSGLRLQFMPSILLTLIFSPCFHVSLLLIWRPTVVDTEQGARDKKKRLGFFQAVLALEDPDSAGRLNWQALRSLCFF